MEIPTQTADTLPQYVEAVLGISDGWDESDTWFRGVGKKEFELKPGAYWRLECDEETLFLTFKSQVPSYIAREPRDDWEWYYLMQHYGLPTRLLDWSESALAALYFALTQRPTDGEPCVWLMSPSTLNGLAQGSGAASIFVPGGGETKYWLPDRCGRGKYITQIPDTDHDNSLPIAIYPRRFNPRIVAQRGTFTVHGIGELPIEDLFVKDGQPTQGLARILLPADAREDMLSGLRALGVDRTALFPEPESVAVDLKAVHGLD